MKFEVRVLKERPAGLAFGKVHEGKTAEILSVFVEKEYRGRGVGERLMTELEKIFEEMNCDDCALVYMTGRETTVMFEKLLAKRGFSEPVFRKLVCRASCKLFITCGWDRYLKKLPAGYKIISWSEVSESDRAELKLDNHKNKWIAADLMPFDYESGYEPVTSLAMRYNGAIVGWVINHRIALNTLRYTCSFFKPELQTAARIVAMYYEAVLRQNAVMPSSQAIWTIPSWHLRMIDFAKRRMAPYLDSISETRESRKKIKASV